MRGVKAVVLNTALALTAVAACVYVALDAFDSYVAARRERPLSLSAVADMTPVDRLKYLCPHAGVRIQRSLMLNPFVRGELNYWVRGVDLRKPPPKRSDEFRILLIGFGASQGPGIGSHLADLLNAAPHNPGRFINVIDLSMYGSILYQGYLALNWAGHAFRPDMIVAHTGFMEWAVPLYFEKLPGVFCGFTKFAAADMYFRRAWEMPSGMSWLQTFFPNIMTRTNLGFALKALDIDYFAERGRQGYVEHRGLRYSSLSEMFDKYTIPFFVNTLRSIKRDFLGIPVVVAWQAVENEPDEFLPFGDPRSALGVDFYERIYRTAKYQLQNYLNNDWAFVDVHGAVASDVRQIGFDPSPEAQSIIAQVIARETTSFLRPYLGNRAEKAER
jgi:hypothetical protein